MSHDTKYKMKLLLFASSIDWSIVINTKPRLTVNNIFQKKGYKKCGSPISAKISDCIGWFKARR